MSGDATLVAFAATTEGARAATFHHDVLGLPVRSDDAFAIAFDAAGTELRLQQAARFKGEGAIVAMAGHQTLIRVP